MIITTAKVLHSTILKIFLALSLLFIALFFVLTSGVTIPNISLPGLKITQFYIKLDKKLIISVDTIEIKKRNRPEGTVKEIDRIGVLVQYLPSYFHQVVIKNLIVGERVFHLLYNDDVFYFDADTFQLASRVFYDPKAKRLSADIRKLYIKEPQLELSGRLSYDFPVKTWRGSGTYRGFGIEGDFNVSHKGDYFSFELDSKPCPSIKALIDYIDPPEPIKVWIYPKIPAKRYVLHYLKGGFTLKKDGSIGFDPRDLRASATAYDARIHFHPDVPPVSTPQIDVTLEDDTLAFRLHHPVYEGKRLDGSSVRIRNLTNIKAELDAHIVVKDRIDASIKKILDAYGIHLPFVQTEGVTDAVVDFTVRLAKGSITRYRGIYRSRYAKLLFDNVVPLPVTDLHLVSEGSKMTIYPCRVRFDPYLDANLSGTLDLHTKRGEFDANIDSLSYGYRGVPLLEMRNTPEHVSLDFREDVRFAIEELDIDILYKKGGMLRVDAGDLQRLKPYFRGPLEPIEGGRVYARYGKSKRSLEAHIRYPNDILNREGKTIDTFDIEANTEEGQTHIRINDTLNVIAQHERTFFNIKNIDIRLDTLLERLESYQTATRTEERRTAQSPGHLFYIEGHESTVTYKKFSLPCTFYNVKILPDPLSVKFETKHRSGEIRGIVENGKINIAGKELSDRIMHGLTTLDQLRGGRFDFDAKGELQDFNGTILIRDSLWTKTAFYNNLLATLNTIPAILTLKNPGFSKNGFKIKRGAFDYRFKGRRLFFKKIVIEGYSAQITGKGSIDFESETIAMRLQIHFLESLTSVLNKIPVAGYLIFGKDGTLAVTLNINGPLENPNVATEATKDLIKAPLNILERTLTLPFKIFE
ncbi:YhdP family protein [Hydrogenimonas sp.]